MAQCKPKALHLDEVPPKDMKKKRKKRKGKKKQNLCFGKLEECSSGKGILDLKEAYKEKPVQEEIPARKGEEQPAEDTTEIQQEEASEDVQSEDDAWENKEESWSPEIEGVSDPRPDGTRLTYERDFLLQLQTNPICMQKPEGLPDLEIILVQARTPSKPGFQQNINACRMPKGDGGENMFLPAYIRQGSKQCLPSQPFLHSQRPVRIRGPPPPNNQPVDTCLPGAPVVQMIGYPGPTQFLAPRKPGPFIPQHVDFQLPMGGPPQYRPPQAMQGQSPLVSGPSQPNGPFVYQQSSGYPIGQPPPPVYIVRAPATPLQGMQQFQPQFEPRPRERKIFQIKDPISNKDVTQEILKRQPASSLTSTAVGTPNNTPNLSGQSSSSGIPPLTSQQQAEANVRAQFAAQVAATLVNSEDRPKKPEYTIQKSTVNNRADVDIVKAKETLNVQKEEGLKSARKNDTVSNVMETVQETQMKEGTVPVKSQPKEAVQGSKLCEGSSSDSSLGSKSLVSSVDATTLANGKISNVSCRVEIFTKEVLYKESQKSNAPFVCDVVKTDEKVKPSDECDKDEKVQLLDECEKDEKVKVVDECEEDEKVKRLDEGEKEVATDALPVSESNILNGPMEESQEQAKEDTEEVITIDSQPEVEAAVPGTASETLKPNEVSKDNGKELTEPEETFAQTEESKVLLPSSEPQEGSGNEKVHGNEVDLKKSAVANTPVDSHGSVPPRDMKKKKQKHRLRELEKRSSEKETDMMESYTEKPVQQETPDEGEEQPAEETTESQQEVQVTEDAQSDDDTWETKEEETSAQTEESEVLLPSSVAQEGSGIEEVDGGDGKRSAVAKTPFDSQGSGSSVPLEILARGSEAVYAFQKAMQTGKVKVYRGRIIILGQDRAGKTSLKKSLLSLPFDPSEESTVGVEACEVEVDQVMNWTPSERKKLEESEFGDEIAKLIAKDLIQTEVDKKNATMSQLDEVQKSSLEEEVDEQENLEPPSNEAESSAYMDQKCDIVEEVGKSKDGGPVKSNELELNIDSVTLPNNVADLVVRYLQDLRLEDEVKTKEVILSLWDFAGQRLYYAAHSVFLSQRAVYVLVYNLNKNLLTEAKPCCRMGINEILLENFNNESNLDNLLSWLVSVHSIRSVADDAQENLENEIKKLPYLQPPVIIVGTHADQPFEDVKTTEKRIKDRILGKEYGKHVIAPFFAVNNKSENDQGVQKLRQRIMEVLKNEPYMGEEVPLRWFYFEKVVEALVAKSMYHMDLDQLLPVIKQVCRIDDEDETTALLNFYHDLGVIVKHGRTVVLQAQWLIDLFKQLITVPPFDEADPLYRNYWKELQDTGILKTALVDHVFSDFIEKGLRKQDILEMMELYALIAKFSSGMPTSENKEEPIYFVPTQLTSSPSELCEIKPSERHPCPLFVDFLDGFVPHGLFPQFVSRCISWCSENGFKETPKLFNNGASFSLGKHIIFALICRKRFIKVVLKRLPCSNKMAVKVRTFIEGTLNGLSQDLSWLSNLRYQLSVACTHCLQSDQDDTLHLLRVLPCGELASCRKNFSHATVTVPGLEKWFELQHSQNEEQEMDKSSEAEDDAGRIAQHMGSSESVDSIRRKVESIGLEDKGSTSHTSCDVVDEGVKPDLDQVTKRLSLKVTELPLPIYSKVCVKLNVERNVRFDDFRMLAQKVGLKRDETDYIHQKFLNHTDKILRTWSTKLEATVGKLIELLKEEDFAREDVVQVLQDWVNER